MAVVDAVSAQQRPEAPLDVASLRRDFPILAETVNGHPLVYLDNAATSQKPRQVIQALVDYYEHHNAPVHRSGHTLGVRASNLYEGTRSRLAHFLNAPEAAEIIFTRNTTEAINLVAYTWGAQNLAPGDEIVLTQMEHHSNLVPWQILAEARGAHLRFVPLTPTHKFDLAAYTQLLNPRVKLVALPHVSNVLGTITPVAEVARLAHQVGAVVLVDGAQSVPHMPVDLQALGCDFFALSSHKMLGPTGVGALWGRRELLEAMPPFLAGGSMIGEVQWTRSTWAPLPQKFEAGVPNTADVVAFGAAIEYLDNLGLHRVRQHEIELTRYALTTLRERHPELTLYGPNDLAVRAGVVAFNLKGGAVHPHDVAQLLDEQGIAVRAGHHCARPLHSVLGAPSSVRASFYVYNTREEVDALARGLDVVKRVFRGVLERPEGGA
ncbi:MAG TPA: cysteine desulfurase [Chloroflexota bacterium]|nr:cysteine desulfurase [Chloroflexota bacterium]